ncbi:N-acetylmuramoyl-L-alanine amidase [Kitasatospora sp. NPDC004669]|uniref:peptidoglycan recognition protein family protein n=1 Tax=Kitasatospora sp. NPDC004669 TaxID=3154555 RepID=UPI0033A86554
MRISIPAAVLAGCITVLLFQPTAVAVDDSGAAAPAPRTSAGGGSVTSVALTSGGAVAPRSTRSFELLGVVWDGSPTALAGGFVRVRTRDAATGRWSDWHTLEADAVDGPDAVAHGATAPLWAGRSDGVAVDVHPGPAGLPRGLRVELVDPGQGAAASTDAQTLPERPAGPETAAAPRPGIVTRAGWGADESIREAGFVYTGAVRVAFVHHTATATDYACSDAPRVIRSIYQYHVQSNGWRDIGYNFLVDRCGTIYEGRAGGVDQPVFGAHTLGFNTNSSGIAAIGTFSSDTPPQELQDGLAKISAWKLGLTGRSAGGTAQLTSGSDASLYPKGTVVAFHAISGHRDGFATECPGEALYARLPAIRGTAVRLQG